MAAGGEIEKVASKFRRIPAKWKDYSCCGKVLIGERLISFKTPLSEKYHCNGMEFDPEDCLQKDEEFTPRDLLKTLKKKDHVLGLVVDLTNTARYYNPEEFKSRGIQYKKIKCVGKSIPGEEVVQTFKATLLSFFKKFSSSTSLVGVHCTHGLNRAGYVVCRYLIECRGYFPEKAIEAYNTARGHEMERENYLEDLKQRQPKVLSKNDVDLLIETTPVSDHVDGYHRNESDHRLHWRPFRRGRPGRLPSHEYWSEERNRYRDRYWRDRYRDDYEYYQYYEDGFDDQPVGYEANLYDESRGNERYFRHRPRYRYEDDHQVRSQSERDYRRRQQSYKDSDGYKFDSREDFANDNPADFGDSSRAYRRGETYQQPDYREREGRHRARARDRDRSRQDDGTGRLQPPRDGF